jgi:hypothetical protein
MKALPLAALAGAATSALLEAPPPPARGLHSSTFQLNLSHF